MSHYGHGYGVLVSQGKPETGLATNWNNDGYGWTGFGAPGDSGSPVVLTGSGEAAGNFTHLIVDIGTYPGSNLAGTRITKILQFAGVSLVNADGSTTGAASTELLSQPREGGVPSRVPRRPLPPEQARGPAQRVTPC